MDNELELHIKEGLNLLVQVGNQMEALKVNLLTGASLPPLQPPPEWSVLRERIKRLTEDNEATHNLAEQIGRLSVSTSQSLTKLEEENGKQ
jgi:hypothetical protein